MSAEPMRDAVLHAPTDRPIEWTTVNAGEAFPGVQTPLTWTYSGLAAETLSRGGFTRIGAFSLAERAVPPDPTERMMGIFYGQPAYNLDRFCDIGDRLPGSSDGAIEQQFFGTALRPKGTPRRRRYPVVAAKLPIAAVAARRRLLAGGAHRRWQSATGAPPHDRAAMLARLEDSFDWLAGMDYHAVLSMVAQGIWEQVHRQAAKAGKAALAQQLLVDGAGSQESGMVRDLWSLSRERLTLAAFVAEHGFHGPGKLDLATSSWREDPRPLLKLAAAYAGMGDDESPEALQRRQAREAAEAERELLGALSPGGRAVMRRLLGPARTYMRYREAGRCDLLRAADVARHAARALAEDLAAAGVIGEPGDLFFLTWAELRALPADPRALIAGRRAERARYETLALPERWTGPVEAIVIREREALAAGEILSGIAASSGVVEGVARVIRSPADSDALQPGEILVCRTTDPSWASYFFVAGAVVIDIGGPLSHGAIVAREMGIPCVINVHHATKVLRSGDRIRVDGDTGEVRRL